MQNGYEKLRQLLCEEEEIRKQINYKVVDTSKLRTIKPHTTLAGEVIIDVREIIFTTEFMEQFEANCQNLSGKYWKVALLENLDDPVSYLYNLIICQK